MNAARFVWRALQDTRGVSLMELMISVIMLQAVFLMVFAGYSSGVILLSNTSREWESQEDARASLQLLARNLRQATEIAVATASQVGFYADLDNDGVQEAVMYRLAPAEGAIERGVSQTDGDADGRADAMPTTFTVFLPSVVNAAGSFLTYYDANGVEISGGSGWPHTIRAIGFEVMVDVRTDDLQAPGRYRTIVQMRNVGFRSF